MKSKAPLLLLRALLLFVLSVPVGAIGKPDGVPAKAIAAYIKDPDGYTNVRETGSKEAEVVFTVVDKELFWTIPVKGQWWQVWNDAGETGFMHNSRISVQPELTEETAADKEESKSNDSPSAVDVPTASAKTLRIQTKAKQAHKIRVNSFMELDGMTEESIKKDLEGYKWDDYWTGFKLGYESSKPYRPRLQRENIYGGDNEGPLPPGAMQDGQNDGADLRAGLGIPYYHDDQVEP